MNEHMHQNCDALLSSLSEFIDGELSEELCREIQQHLETCGDCRAVLNTTRRTIDLVRVQRSETAGLPQEIRARLFERLDLRSFIKRDEA